jgi:DNA-binding beta-propeller fold protein YncE
MIWVYAQGTGTAIAVALALRRPPMQKRSLVAFLTIVLAGVLIPVAANAQAPTYITQWGTYGSGDGQLFYPWGIAVDGSGNVYVTDYDNHRIQKFTSDGDYITQWGTYGSGDGQFWGPSGIAVDASGNVYVADTYNSRIEVFTSNGTYLTQWGTLGGGSGNGQFNYVYGVAVDASGNVYAVDMHNNRIQKFGYPLVPAQSTSWGRIKSLYR